MSGLRESIEALGTSLASLASAVAGRAFPNLVGAKGNDGVGIATQTNPLPVFGVQAFIDADNSSSSTLTAGNSFTGTAVEVGAYQAVLIQVSTDQDSAADGLKIQSSSDGTNWDHEHAYSVTGGEPMHIEETLPAQYYRIVYTNGGTNQTYFRLQSKVLAMPATMHVHSIDHALTANHPAQVVRSVITGETTGGGGGFVNVKVDPSGTVQTETNLGQTEDAAHTTGDTGVMGLGVRNDAMAERASANGDYSPFAVNQYGSQISASQLDQWFLAGKLRLAAATLTSGIASTQSFRLGNPAASGVTLLVVKTIVTSTVAAQVTVNKNGTLGAPSSATVTNPNFGGSSSTSGDAQYQATAFTAGTTIATTRAPADIPIQYDLPFLLTESTSVGVSATFSVGATMNVGVLYVEDP